MSTPDQGNKHISTDDRVTTQNAGQEPRLEPAHGRMGRGGPTALNEQQGAKGTARGAKPRSERETRPDNDPGKAVEPHDPKIAQKLPVENTIEHTVINSAATTCTSPNFRRPVALVSVVHPPLSSRTPHSPHGPIPRVLAAGPRRRGAGAVSRADGGSSGGSSGRDSSTASAGVAVGTVRRGAPLRRMTHSSSGTGMSPRSSAPGEDAHRRRCMDGPVQGRPAKDTARAAGRFRPYAARGVGAAPDPGPPAECAARPTGARGAGGERTGLRLVAVGPGGPPSVGVGPTGAAGGGRRSSSRPPRKRR